MTRFGKEILKLIILLVFTSTANSKEYNYNLIAHAGGAFKGDVYLNSKEAILNSIKNKFINIEIDLQITSDGMIYGLHKWKDIKKFSPNDIKILKEKDEARKLTYNDLKIFNQNNSFKILLEEDIVSLLNANNHIVLFTDKISNFKKLKNFFSKFNNKKFVEVYSFKDYLIAKKYGFKNIIYSSDLSKFDIIIINLLNMKNISFSKKEIEDNNKMNFIIDSKNKINFFCYTVNNLEFLKKNENYIKYFYTDFLLPLEK